MPVTLPLQVDSGQTASKTKKKAVDKKLPKSPKAAKPRKVSEYERNRTIEVASRARHYQLRVKKMEGELLDRKLVATEIDYVFSAIRGIVLASELPTRDKTDILNNLGSIPLMLENVTQRQNATEESSETQNGHEEAGD